MAFLGSNSPTNEVGVRYLIDGNVDRTTPPRARSGVGPDLQGDVIQDMPSNSATVSLSRQITLRRHAHDLGPVAVHHGRTAPTATTCSSGPLLADRYRPGQRRASPPTGSGPWARLPITAGSGTESVTAGAWKTVSSLGMGVGTGKTGIYHLSFQATVRPNSNDTTWSTPRPRRRHLDPGDPAEHSSAPS